MAGGGDGDCSGPPLSICHYLSVIDMSAYFPRDDINDHHRHHLWDGDGDDGIARLRAPQLATRCTVPPLLAAGCRWLPLVAIHSDHQTPLARDVLHCRTKIRQLDSCYRAVR